MCYKILSALLMSITLAVVLFVLRFPSCLLWCLRFVSLMRVFCLTLCFILVTWLKCHLSSFNSSSWKMILLHLWLPQPAGDIWCIVWFSWVAASMHYASERTSMILPVWLSGTQFPSVPCNYSITSPVFLSRSKIAAAKYLAYPMQHMLKVEVSCSCSSKTVASVAKVRRIMSTFLLPNQGCCHNSISLHTEEHMEDTEQHMESGCQNHWSRMMSL